MGAKKNVTIENTDEIKVAVSHEQEAPANTDSAAPAETTTKNSKKTKVAARSQKYIAARALVDKSKYLPITEAIDLAKRTSYSKFTGTISADLVLKEVNNQIEVTFPHQTGKVLRIAIVDDALLEQITAGKIDFDILLTTPAFMPKLAKLARTLGPKGLMPNPKNQTIIADPLKRKAELESGKTVLKTERKVPLLHVTLGKANIDTDKLAENYAAVMKAVGDKTLKVSVSATMGPGIKVALNK